MLLHLCHLTSAHFQLLLQLLVEFDLFPESIKVAILLGYPTLVLLLGELPCEPVVFSLEILYVLLSEDKLILQLCGRHIASRVCVVLYSSLAKVIWCNWQGMRRVEVQNSLFTECLICLHHLQTLSLRPHLL